LGTTELNKFVLTHELTLKFFGKYLLPIEFETGGTPEPVMMLFQPTGNRAPYFVIIYKDDIKGRSLLHVSAHAYNHC